MENDLTIIPVLNKIDLPAAQPEKYAEELAGLIGCDPPTACRSPARPVSAWSRAARRDRRPDPAPGRRPDAPARAMIFDSVYDTYRGVVTYVRVVDGNLNPRERILMMSPRPPTSCSRSASSPGARARPRGSASARSATSSPA
jgi:GTP-binding protein LepA